MFLELSTFVKIFEFYLVTYPDFFEKIPLKNVTNSKNVKNASIYSLSLRATFILKNSVTFVSISRCKNSMYLMTLAPPPLPCIHAFVKIKATPEITCNRESVRHIFYSTFCMFLEFCIIVYRPFWCRIQ